MPATRAMPPPRKKASPPAPRRPSPRRWVWAAGIAAAATLIILDRSGWLLVPARDDHAAYHGRSAQVTRVIDGDTIEVALHDALAGTVTTRVRLWGVDAPELASRLTGRDEPEPFAREAAELARSLTEGVAVTLRVEPQRLRDRWRRLLAHVELPDGSSLNEALLEAGLARADDGFTHALLGRYAQVELSARRRGVGLWSRP